MTNNNRRVFIVEDEVMVAFEMADSLEDMGFDVVGPSVHLEDAQARAQEEQFDVAFLDVNLGSGKNSSTVADILRQRGIPYVFITAYDRESIEFLQDGDRVLKKPVSGHELIETLKNTFSSA